MLPSRLCLGIIDKKSLKQEHIAPAPKAMVSTRASNLDGLPPLESMINSFDFEQVAKLCMSKEGWDYFSSGSDDEITLRENHLAFQRIWFVPRILVDVETIDFSTSILGYRSSIPLYFSATALGKLAHPEGECALVRAADISGVPYMLPTLSSCSIDEMLNSCSNDQVIFSQLYFNKDRERTKKYIQKCESRGVKALFVTVDAPYLGRREKDMRNKFTKSANVQNRDTVDRNYGVARAISSFIDPSVNWNDIAFLKKITKMRIILKGVQCSEDALLALHLGCSGIVLSNHGGRQLDTTRSGIEILPEVIRALRSDPMYSKKKFEVFVDGGIRRGSDIVKAIALGATAVGIGRAVIYALAAFGSKGVQQLVSILKSEVEMVLVSYVTRLV